MVPNPGGESESPRTGRILKGKRQQHLVRPFSLLGAACESGPNNSLACAHHSQYCQSLGPWKMETGKTPILLFNGVGHECVPISSFFPFPVVPSTAVLKRRWRLQMDSGVSCKVSSQAQLLNQRLSAGHRSGVACSPLRTSLKFSATPLFLLQKQKPKEKFSEMAHRWLWANCFKIF